MTQKYSWLPFYKLAWGEQFFLGAARAEKANTLTAWKGGMRVFINPLKRVRSMRPYGKVAKPAYIPCVTVVPQLCIVSQVKTEQVAGEESPCLPKI